MTPSREPQEMMLRAEVLVAVTFRRTGIQRELDKRFPKCEGNRQRR